MKGKRLSIAAIGWIILPIWFVIFEFCGWYFESWTLSQQWWTWMLAIPTWLAWVFFVAYIALGVHLWWPLLKGKSDATAAANGKPKEG